MRTRRVTRTLSCIRLASTATVGYEHTFTGQAAPSAPLQCALTTTLLRGHTFATLLSTFRTQTLITTMDARRTSTSLLSSLPADVLHQILEYSSSMDDFSAVIRTSKRIYGVYKDHPGSILRSVVCHQLDMTKEIFPLAFGLVLHHERVRESAPPVKDWLRDDELSASHLNPSRFRNMVSNHDVVTQLEKEFSRR